MDTVLLRRVYALVVIEHGVPRSQHPMRILARVAADLGLRGTIAADHDGYPGILGYIGPKLSEVTGAEIIGIAAQIETMLARKSPAEVELLRESGRWCSHAHRLLQEYSVPGSTEAEASLRAQSEATLTMLAERGSGGLLGSGDGVKQATGARSATAAPGLTPSRTTSDSSLAKCS